MGQQIFWFLLDSIILCTKKYVNTVIPNVNDQLSSLVWRVANFVTLLITTYLNIV